MDEIRITTLDWGDEERVAEARDLVVAAFAQPGRYGDERIARELSPSSDAFYRQFFIARLGRQVVGVAGIKAADWATETHILYLSAVESSCRGRGIGRALVEARVAWLEGRFERGRVLVSTPKPRRFKALGFRVVSGSRKADRWLMIREFS